MSDFGPGARCDGCAFWRRMDKEGGTCRRRAPAPGNSPNDIAHWPRTYQDEACGEWRSASNDAASTVSCKQCIYWEHLAHGFVPVDKQDQFSDWWRQTGHCLRLAPIPSSEPGNRSFWRSTHASDACSKGKVA